MPEIEVVPSGDILPSRTVKLDASEDGFRDETPEERWRRKYHLYLVHAVLYWSYEAGNTPAAAVGVVHGVPEGEPVLRLLTDKYRGSTSEASGVRPVATYFPTSYGEALEVARQHGNTAGRMAAACLKDKADRMRGLIVVFDQESLCSTCMACTGAWFGLHTGYYDRTAPAERLANYQQRLREYEAR